MVYEELESLKREVAHDGGIQLYAWEIGRAADGFSDTVPAQHQIPRPVGLDCKALICFFGERIGSPLPQDFPLSDLEALDALCTTRPYHLVHPWIMGEEEHGGFSLTGTTFEYLAALAESVKNRATPGLPERVLLRFVGDDSVLDRDVPLSKALWGNRRLREEAFRRLSDDYDALSHWIAENKSQLKQLRNFIEFLKSFGIAIHVVHDFAEAKDQVRSFLIKTLGFQIIEIERDPFKGLESYNVEDTTVFFGRNDELKVAVSEFLGLWQNSSRPTSLCITGGSGVGKSSFLRAGLVARLRKEKSQGYYFDCIVRPAELLPIELSSGANHNLTLSSETAVTRLLQLTFERMDLGRSPHLQAHAQETLRDLARIDAELRAEWAVERLDAILRLSGDGHRLIIAVDQFEELIDQRRDPIAGPLWEPLVRFIAAACSSERVGFVYTVQASRDGLVADDPILGELWANGGQVRLPFPEQSIPEIIRLSFEITGRFRVDPSLVTEFTRRVFSFRETGANFQGSLLPIISMSLRRLYLKCALPLLNDLSSKGEKRQSDRVTLTAANCAEFLTIEDAIAELGDEAVSEAKAKAGPDWDGNTLGDLFRRLVELRGDQYGLPDALVPTSWAANLLAQALRKRRLILPGEDGGIRLVHEAVLHHWGLAKDWLEAERPLLADASALMNNAREWVTTELRSREFLEGLGPIDVDRAARILSMWHDILRDTRVQSNGRDTHTLRDFALELLFAHPTPSKIADRTTRKPTHLIIAAEYERTDMLRGFLELEPESINLQRSDKRSALFWPCFMNNEEILDLLLSKGARFDEPDIDGWLAVHAAAAGDSINCLRKLSSCGAQLEPVNPPGGMTLVHLASQHSGVKVLDYLLHEKGFNASPRNEAHWTPLHLAAAVGNSAAISLLVNANAEVDPVAPYGWTPLQIAVQNSQHVAIAKLLELGANSRHGLKNGWTPLHRAALEGEAEIARLLLQHGADLKQAAENDWSNEKELEELALRRVQDPYYMVGSMSWQAIHIAANNNQTQVISVLISAGADVNVRTGSLDTPLHIAAEKGSRSVVAALNSSGVLDWNARNRDGETPLQIALRKLDILLAQDLIGGGAKVRGDGNEKDSHWTPLHDAVRRKWLEGVALLLKNGADPDAVNTLGETPLHIASADGFETAVQLLLMANANVSLVSDNGVTALQLACLEGRVGIATRLIDRDPGALCAPSTFPPLHLAAAGGFDELLQRLLEQTHVVDVRDEFGWTPLHVAALCGSRSTAEMLLKVGADIKAITFESRSTPLDVAVGSRSLEIADFLERRGAQATESRQNQKSPGECLPLHFGIRSITEGPMNAKRALSPEQIFRRVRAAVLDRDLNTCRFCGFLSPKYQSVVALRGTYRDPENCVTACTFCAQVAQVNHVEHMKSGLLIWLPEVSQPELNSLMRRVFFWRITQKPKAVRSRLLFDALKARQDQVSIRCGVTNLGDLTTLLESTRVDVNFYSKARELQDAGLRLLPLDRRVVKEEDLEFNMFPQILAYWRSKAGPFFDTLEAADPTFDQLEMVLAK